MNNEMSLKEILRLTASDGCTREEQSPVQPFVMRHGSKATIRITPGNADSRIRDACEVIIRLWGQWDAEAQHDAQTAQDPQAWFDTMMEHLGAVVTGMVCDECHWCGGSGVVDSGGMDEQGRFINVPCTECVPQEDLR